MKKEVSSLQPELGLEVKSYLLDDKEVLKSKLLRGCLPSLSQQFCGMN